jgi:hypothetical protein
LPWSAVLAALIRSSLAPPSGSCSACGDLLVDDVTVAGIAFRWGFTNLGRFARDYQDLSGETLVNDLAEALRRERSAQDR